MKSGEDLLQQVVKAFPFLLELPKEFLTQLDTSEFYIPPVELLPLVHSLEQVLQAHIMLYRAGTILKPPSGKIHLCSILAPAFLQSSQLAILHEIEHNTRFTDKVRWVAYDKPINLRGKFAKPSDG